MPVECSDIPNQCDCSRINHCFWNSGACQTDGSINCPDVDIMLAFDGGAGMGAPFGGFPKGYEQGSTAFAPTQLQTEAPPARHSAYASAGAAGGGGGDDGVERRVLDAGRTPEQLARMQ
eukprot:gene3531-5247_t